MYVDHNDVVFDRDCSGTTVEVSDLSLKVIEVVFLRQEVRGRRFASTVYFIREDDRALSQGIFNVFDPNRDSGTDHLLANKRMYDLYLAL